MTNSFHSKNERKTSGAGAAGVTVVLQKSKEKKSQKEALERFGNIQHFREFIRMESGVFQPDSLFEFLPGFQKEH